jgi:hypothetical protein
MLGRFQSIPRPMELLAGAHSHWHSIHNWVHTLPLSSMATDHVFFGVAAGSVGELAAGSVGELAGPVGRCYSRKMPGIFQQRESME